MNRRLYDWNFLIAFLAQTAFTITNSLLAHYARWIGYLGGSLADVGQVSSVAALVGLVTRPVLAPWIDRIGPRACWCIAGSVVFAATLANLLVEEVGVALYVLRSIQAVGVAIVFASGLTYIAQTTPPERRTEAIGVLGAGGFAGLLIGPALGDYFLLDPDRTRSDFIGYFLCTAGGVGLSLFLVPFTRACPKPPPDEVPGWHPVEFFRAVRAYWPGKIVLITFAFGVCMTVPFVFLAKYIDGIRGAKLWWFFLAYASVGLGVRLGLRNWPDQFGARRVLAIGMGLFALSMWSFLWTDSEHAWRILIPGILGGAAHGLTFHAMVALVLEPFPSSARGAGSTLSLMGIDVGAFAGAQFLGRLADLYGYTPVFHVVAVCCLASVAIYLAPTVVLRRPAPKVEIEAVVFVDPLAD